MKISGTLSQLPAGVEALVTLSDGQQIMTRNSYSFEVESGTYTVMPILTGCRFTPYSITVEVGDADVIADFVDPPIVNYSLTVTFPRRA